MPYLIAIEAAVFLHVFVSFFDSHLINVYGIWISGESWDKGSLGLGSGGDSSALVEDLSDLLILCIIL